MASAQAGAFGQTDGAWKGRDEPAPGWAGERPSMYGPMAVLLSPGPPAPPTASAWIAGSSGQALAPRSELKYMSYHGNSLPHKLNRSTLAVRAPGAVPRGKGGVHDLACAHHHDDVG